MAEESTNTSLLQKWGLKSKPAQLDLLDLQVAVKQSERLVAKFENEAIEAENRSKAAKAKAFSQGVSHAERERLVREFHKDDELARKKTQRALECLADYGSLSDLATMLETSIEMKKVGIADSDDDVANWQHDITHMQMSLAQLSEQSKELRDHIKMAMRSNPVSTEIAAETSRINDLITLWENESDPVKKAEYQRRLESGQTTLALA